MAGPAPKTKNWIARENAHKPKGWHIIVSGQVELTNANLAPRLTESAERNPKHLGLTLSIESAAIRASLPGSGRTRSSTRRSRRTNTTA